MQISSIFKPMILLANITSVTEASIPFYFMSTSWLGLHHTGNILYTSLIKKNYFVDVGFDLYNFLCFSQALTK